MTTNETALRDALRDVLKAHFGHEYPRMGWPLLLDDLMAAALASPTAQAETVRFRYRNDQPQGLPDRFVEYLPFPAL